MTNDVIAATESRVARWSDAWLDSMRELGDPPADRVIAALFRDREVETARRLLRVLVQNDVPPPEGLPREVLEYLKATDMTGLDTDAIDEGQELFAEHGPLILMCLCHYSLPAAYAAAKGVEVLHRTAYLEKRPAKRLFETTQMVIDVMSPGGLEPRGRGVRTLQKVRLMHAMVRHLVRNDPAHPWDPKLGVPINQEDLAGTLMTFSWLTLDGLAKLGIEPSEKAKQEYLALWRAVGRLMGVVEELLPATLSEAQALTERIQGRQIAPSEAGRLLTGALLEMVAQAGDVKGLKQISGALMRHFLPDDVADFLGVPRHALDALLAEVIRVFADRVHLPVAGHPGIAQAARAFSLHYIQWMIDVELGGRSAPFVIPDRLQRRWHLDPKSEPSFWRRLLGWILKRLPGVG